MSNSKVVSTVEKFGRFCILSGDILKRGFVEPIFGNPLGFREIVNQTVRMGIKSIPIVSLISICIGMILAMNSAPQLAKFGATIFVSSLVSTSAIIELGPLMTAIIIAGRVGAGITAEIGSMVVAEEVSALRMMAVNPVRFLLVPRLIALVISLPILTQLSDLLECGGGMLIGVAYLNISPELFYKTAMDSLILKDIFTGFTKSIVFAFIIAFIACYNGYTVKGGAVGVGRATTDTVVLSIVYVIFADLLFTALFYFI